MSDLAIDKMAREIDATDDILVSSMFQHLLSPDEKVVRQTLRNQQVIMYGIGCILIALEIKVKEDDNQS